MRIREVIIDGFKSYAHRVNIGEFHPQFNAITGANGTGKSNIFDGICFALGFRPSECMRVSCVSELIFQRGQAGINAAAVTLVFDNTDKSTSPLMYTNSPKITLTRQIAIGGRDRYFVNNVVKKPTEVLKILQEAKINTQQPHFLVMQGRVTKMINMKPHELLEVFQEAAGTNVFDKEKEKSMKVVQEKQTQLDHINKDITENLTPALDYLRKEKYAKCLVIPELSMQSELCRMDEIRRASSLSQIPVDLEKSRHVRELVPQNTSICMYSGSRLKSSTLRKL